MEAQSVFFQSTFWLAFQRQQGLAGLLIGYARPASAPCIRELVKVLPLPDPQTTFE